MLRDFFFPFFINIIQKESDILLINALSTTTLRSYIRIETDEFVDDFFVLKFLFANL
jgi:hypothetical protein